MRLRAAESGVIRYLTKRCEFRSLTGRDLQIKLSIPILKMKFIFNFMMVTP